MKQRLVATLLCVVAAALAMLSSSLSPIIKVATQCPTAVKQTIQEIVYEPASSGEYVAVVKERPVTQADQEFKACHCAEKKKADQTSKSDAFTQIPPFLAPSVASRIVFSLATIDRSDHFHLVQNTTQGNHTPLVPPPNAI